MNKKIEIGIYLIVGIITVFLVIRLLRTGKRRKKQATKSDKIKAVKTMRTMEQFNPDYQLNRVFARIGDNAADLYANDLRKACHIPHGIGKVFMPISLGTDEEKIYSTFGKLKNKANISEVSARYYLKFQRDLRADILNDLTDNEKVILLGIINKLPDIT